MDDHTIEEIEFDADEDDDDVPLDAPSISEKKKITHVKKAQEEIPTEKDDNFFVQQKSGDTEDVIGGDEIAPGDSGGTKEITANPCSRRNTNNSNSHQATVNEKDLFMCAKCDKTLLEPPVSCQK